MLSHEIGTDTTTRRCSFCASIRSHLWREQNLPPSASSRSPLSVKTFHSPSPLVSHLPLFTFTHLGLSIAPGILSYMCNAPSEHKRVQGNSCDYGGMIPSGLTRLLTKLFDRTNSGTPRGRERVRIVYVRTCTCWLLVETLFSRSR